MNFDRMRAELVQSCDREQQRIQALEQLLHDYRQFVREGDSRNNAVVIVHADATVDVLERRATELIGE